MDIIKTREEMKMVVESLSTGLQKNRNVIARLINCILQSSNSVMIKLWLFRAVCNFKACSRSSWSRLNPASSNRCSAAKDFSAIANGNRYPSSQRLRKWLADRFLVPFRSRDWFKMASIANLCRLRRLNSKAAFRRKSSHDVFQTLLQYTVVSLNELGHKVGDFGTHSFRKGVEPYTVVFNGGPSSISCEIQNRRFLFFSWDQNLGAELKKVRGRWEGKGGGGPQNFPFSLSFRLRERQYLRKCVSFSRVGYDLGE